jgi:hypothetical protein
MTFYNALRMIANFFGIVRDVFYDWGGDIANVFIIGQYLTPRLYAVGNWFANLEYWTDKAAIGWLDVYNDLQDAIQDSPMLTLLLRYADDLISFIRYPFDWIIDAIGEKSQEARELINDPIGFVLETIYTYTGLDVDFVSDPIATIRRIVRNLIRDVQAIIDDPRSWLENTLQDIFPGFFDFISHPGLWIQDRIEDRFPYAVDFLRDPEGYLKDKVLDAIEDAARDYLPRILRITESILHKVF